MKGKRIRAPLFGDDVFISYKRTRAASAYARALASELTQKKLSCFCDLYGTSPGEELPDSLRRRIRRSALFVLVGSAEVADSKSVREEVEEFLSTKRPIIPITFEEQSSVDGTLGRAAWFKQIKGMALEPESAEALEYENPKYGRPSSSVIDRIVDTEGFVSRNRRMLRNFWATVISTVAVLILGVVGAAVLLYNTWVEVEQVQQDRRHAELERERAGDARDWALAEQALAQLQARDEQEKANRAVIRQQEAEASADRAQVRQKIAERQERRARAERLATAAEASVAEHPQRSLALAYAAVQILREAGDPGNAAAEQALRRALAGTGGLLLRHEASVGAVAISADSRWLATGSADGTIRVWDLTSDSLAREPIELHLERPHEADQIQLSPDGRWLIARDSWRAQLWDLREKQRFDLEDPGYVVQNVGFTPDGLRAVTVGRNVIQAGSVLVWDLATVGRNRAAVPLRVCGVELQRSWSPWNERDPRMTSAIPSADFRWILTSQQGTAPVLLDLASASPQEEAITLPNYSELDFTEFAVSPNQEWLAASRPGSRIVYLWHLRGHKSPVGPARLEGDSGLASLKFSPDNRWLVSANSAKALLWDLESSRSGLDWPLRYTLNGHKGEVNATFSPDSELLATAGSNESGRREEGIQIWDLSASDPSKEPYVLEGHHGAIRHLSFSPNGQWLSVAGSSTAELWELISRKEVEDEDREKKFGEWPAVFNKHRSFGKPILVRGHERAIGNVAAFSPNSRWFVTGGKDPVARLWDLKAQNWCAAPRRLPEATDIVWADSVRHWLVAKEKTGRLYLWDLRKEPSARPTLLGFFPGISRPSTMGISFDGRWLVLLGWSESHLLELERGGHWELRGPRFLRPSKVGFTPDSNWLLAGDSNEIFGWNLRNLHADSPAEGIRVVKDDHSTRSLRESPAGLQWSPNLDLLPTPTGEGKLDEIGSTTFGTRRLRRRRASGSPDGRWIIVLQGTGIYLHPSGPEQLAEEARKAGVRSLDPKEWQEYFPGQSYRETVKNPLSGHAASRAGVPRP